MDTHHPKQRWVSFYNGKQQFVLRNIPFMLGRGGVARLEQADSAINQKDALATRKAPQDSQPDLHWALHTTNQIADLQKEGDIPNTL